MFRKNTNNNYLEVKIATSYSEFTVIAINDPFNSSNNYSEVGSNSGGAQYNTSEWKSIVQVYDFDVKSYSRVHESLNNGVREYEIIESDSSYRATTLKKYKVKEYVDGFSNYVYTVEYIDFY